jgi:hypothetical protein
MLKIEIKTHGGAPLANKKARLNSLPGITRAGSMGVISGAKIRF